MSKITLEMVKYWVGWTDDEAIKTIRDIANSAYEEEPWTPKILHNNITETWDENEEDRKSQENNKTVSITEINQQIAREMNE
tara:strand:+ start:3008 stop:3253 length:246 start_codon:yes stop_codon:yes gene_type:complete